MFENRQEAGRKLGKIMEKYKNQDCVVLAIPRGGVPVGIEIARHLQCDFALIISRKLPLPDNPEAGFGAVAEDGSLFIHKYARNFIRGEMISRIVEEQKKVILARIFVLRNNRSFPDISGRTVILTDDGIAMGSTMRAAIEMCRHKGAGKIVVAVPVVGPATAREISRLADDLVVLETPPNFRAVAQVYRNWHDLTDQDVIELQERF